MNSNNFSAMHNIEEFDYQPLVLNTPINKKYFNPLFHTLGFDTTDYQTPHQFLSARTQDTTRNIVAKALPVSKLEGAPNVMYMIASDAVSTLARAGYKSAVYGRGVVKRQVVDRTNRYVKLYLEP